MDIKKGCFLLMFYNLAAAITISINDTDIPTVSPLTNATEISGKYVYPCYASVVVYKTPELRDTYSKGATVYALTRERSDKDIITGFSSSKTNKYGHACVLTLCRKEAIIFVETGNKSTGNLERIYAAPAEKQAILPQYQYAIHTRMEEIFFNVRSWGTILGKSGPVYNEYEFEQCLNAGTQNYHFSFSFLSKEESLETTLPLRTYADPLSWYPLPEGSFGAQVCFMKIKVKISSYQAELQVNSYDSNGSMYGSFKAGPKASPTGDKNVRAACMEFRCAVNNPTKVTGHMSFPKGYSCKLQKAPEVKNLVANSTSFSVNIEVNDNYGPREGIYIDSFHDRAKENCYTGTNQYLTSYEMNPGTNFFISYDCERPSVSPVG